MNSTPKKHGLNSLCDRERRELSERPQDVFLDMEYVPRAMWNFRSRVKWQGIVYEKVALFGCLWVDLARLFLIESVVYVYTNSKWSGFGTCRPFIKAWKPSYSMRTTILFCETPLFSVLVFVILDFIIGSPEILIHYIVPCFQGYFKAFSSKKGLFSEYVSYRTCPLRPQLPTINTLFFIRTR